MAAFCLRTTWPEARHGTGTADTRCGWTTRKLWGAVVKKSTEQYTKTIRNRAEERDLLLIGYRAGMRDAVKHLEGMGVMTVIPDGPGAPDWPKTEEQQAQDELVEMLTKSLLDCHDLITSERPDRVKAAVDVIAMALAQR